MIEKNDCDSCIHFLVCSMYKRSLSCSFYKDSSLFVSLPCQIGDPYYRIVYKRGKIGSSYFYMVREGHLNWYNLGDVLRDLDSLVFLDKDKAFCLCDSLNKKINGEIYD